MKRFTIIIMLTFTAAPLAGCVVYPVRPPAPHVGAVWVPGHYNAAGFWVRGHYA
jgi:hypothetical protein